MLNSTQRFVIVTKILDDIFTYLTFSLLFVSANIKLNLALEYFRFLELEKKDI